MIARHPVIFAMAAIVATAALGLLLRPLTPIDETRYLSVAWEMHQTGNWLVPSKNFAPYSDKPPLLFWAINLVWLVTGVSEFAGRMVVPLSAALAVGLSAALARRLWPEDQEGAGRTALAMASLVIFDMSAGLTMFDVPLTVAVLLGLISLADAGSGQRGLRPWIGFGASVALGVLAKGPVILFHLLPAAVLLPLWAPAGMRWRDMAPRLGGALGVALVLVALWLVPAILTGGAAYRDAILWHQSAGRLSQSFAHDRPWWFYLSLLPLLGFPLLWSPSLWRAARGLRWTAEPGLRLCLIWAGSALLLFSLTSGKQMHYLVPELAAVALIAARLARGRPSFGIFPGVAALVAVAGAAILAGTRIWPAGTPGDLLVPQSALIAWALLVLALCWIAASRGGFGGAMLLSLGGICATNLLIAVTALGPAFSTREIAAALAPYDRSGIAWIGASYHAEFNFAARLTRPVALPQGDAELHSWIARHPGGVILGRRGPADPAWPPIAEFRFRSADYALWSAAPAP